MSPFINLKNILENLRTKARNLVEERLSAIDIWKDRIISSVNTIFNIKKSQLRSQLDQVLSQLDEANPDITEVIQKFDQENDDVNDVIDVNIAEIDRTEKVLTKIKKVYDVELKLHVQQNLADVLFLKPGTREVFSYNVRRQAESKNICIQFPHNFPNHLSWSQYRPGVVLITGGSYKRRWLKSAHQYRLESNEVDVVEEMGFPRWAHATIALNGTQVFAFGGFADTEMSVQPTCEVFVTEDTGWLTLQPMPVGLSFASGTVFDDAIYLTGFNIDFVLKFHPRLYTFEMLESPMLANWYKTMISSVKSLIVSGHSQSHVLQVNGDTLDPTATFPGTSTDTWRNSSEVVYHGDVYYQDFAGSVWQVQVGSEISVAREFLK